MLYIALVAALLVGAIAIVQLTSGAFETSGRETLRALGDPDLWGHLPTLARIVFGDGVADLLGLEPARAVETSTLIVWNVRLPRILAALLVGINLAISGAIFQGITRNELASPYLLGVSSGAGLAVLVVLMLVPTYGPHLPLIATLGGFAAFLLVYSIAWSRGTSSVRLVLAGVVVAAVAGSLQTALFLFAKDLGAVQDAIAWTTGSLTGVGWREVRIAAPWTLVVIALALTGTRALDVLMLGDATARSLGMSVERVRFALATVAILAAAVTIAVAGLVGFVGLIVPHIVRNLVGQDSKRLLLGCLAVGPLLMVAADAVARLAFAPVQLPVGIVTGLLGGSYFLFLMRSRREVLKP